MLVPVQYQRLMAHPDFDRYDLSSFQAKFCTSSPFAAKVKADVLRRWPGRLTEYYGMTEGGGSCELRAHDFPDKLHTVGRPVEGHDIRLIDMRPRGAAREAGEVVGHSATMMSGYHREPGKTADAEWYDPAGKRFIRTGDMGRFDADGFLTLLDRKKDMIISGGFNVYPSDLESGCANTRTSATSRWSACLPTPGETPVGFVVAREGAGASRRNCCPGSMPGWARRSGWPRCTMSSRCRAARSARCSSGSCGTAMASVCDLPAAGITQRRRAAPLFPRRARQARPADGPADGRVTASAGPGAGALHPSPRRSASPPSP